MSFPGAKKMNRDSFRVFHQNNVRLFYHFGLRFIDDIEVVRDIVQDAFIALWQRAGDFQEDEHRKAFIYTMIRNRSLNYLRNRQVEAKNREHLQALQDQASFQNITIEEELYDYLCRKIETLPPMQRDVLWLHIDGLSNEEIAAQLNISVNTVLTHKQRARAILKEYIGRRQNLFFLVFISSL